VAIRQGSGTHPCGESFVANSSPRLLHEPDMGSVVQPVRRIAVNSRRSPRWRQSRELRSSRMPTACLVKPGVARRDFLGITWDSPNEGLRVQPAATGKPGGALSGTRLGTRTLVGDSNCNRIRSLEGRRPRIESPVLPPERRGLLVLCSSRTSRITIPRSIDLVLRRRSSHSGMLSAGGVRG